MPQASKAKTKRKSKDASLRSEAMKRSWRKRKELKGAIDRLAERTSIALDTPKKNWFRLAVDEAVEPEQPIRGQLLDRAKALTLGDRNRAYGDPLDNLSQSANIADAFWAGSDMSERNSAWGVAMDMVLIKLGRIASAPTDEMVLNEDHYIDAINYLAIALEVGQRTPKVA